MMKGPGRSSWSTVMFTVVVVAACYAPEKPKPDDEVEPPSYVPLIESAKQQLKNGDAREALDDLMRATELAESMAGREAIQCPFAESSIDIADQMLEREHLAEARIAYAIAVRFARDCPHLDRADIQSRQRLAANAMQAISAP